MCTWARPEVGSIILTFLLSNLVRKFGSCLGAGDARAPVLRRARTCRVRGEGRWRALPAVRKEPTRARYATSCLERSGVKSGAGGGVDRTAGRRRGGHRSSQRGTTRPCGGHRPSAVAVGFFILWDRTCRALGAAAVCDAASGIQVRSASLFSRPLYFLHGVTAPMELARVARSSARSSPVLCASFRNSHMQVPSDLAVCFVFLSISLSAPACFLLAYCPRPTHTPLPSLTRRTRTVAEQWSTSSQRAIPTRGLCWSRRPADPRTLRYWCEAP